MRALIFAWLLTMLPLTAFGTEPNPFASQCYRLTNLKDGSPVLQHLTRDGFWKDKKMVNTYLLALRGEFDNEDHDKKAGPLDTSDRAGIVLAAIVKKDSILMRRFYNRSVSSYFIDTGWSVMTFAASCNFNEGVFYLLRIGIDPNAGSGVGPFNASLVNGNTSMAREILEHGYSIERDRRRCQSSKFILAHSRNRMPRSIFSLVESAACSGP